MLHQVAGGLREQHLPTVPGAHNAGGVMHIQADVAFGNEGRLARVQAHTYTYHHALRPAMSGESTLGSHSCQDGIASASKRDEESISLRIDFVAAMRAKGRTQQATAFRQNRDVTFTHLLEQVRGPLDVGEEQGDCSRREAKRTGSALSRFVWVRVGRGRSHRMILV